ncbi:MAG: hypothetical protein ABSC77_00935 [Terracidiphilus sp.]|jgi:hypothetical protein
MRKSNRWIVKASVFLLSYSLVSSQGTWGQAPVTSTKTPELYFYTLPSKQLFALGESVVIVLQLYSRSEQPILVSRLQGNEFVNFKVIGPDGNEVPWQDEARAGSNGYSPSDFIVLGQYSETNAKRIISLKDGAGFAFDKPGQYSLTAEFSMGSPEIFAPFAGQAKVPTGSLHSTKLAFCIEACILEPLHVSNNAPQAALNAVQVFYTHVTKYRQLGIPYGRAKKALWPLLSKRLAQQLDSLEACDKDYYRRYGEILRANTYKPATPWLEVGLFTGPNDAATPRIFRILGSRAIGENRVDVELGFTTKQTYSRDLRLSPSYDHYEGVVTAILENNRWVIDDYVAMYENDELQRLSAGYPECKGGQWVGETPY